MSLVSDFALAMHAQAASFIGQESVVIGAVTLSCVLAEAVNSPEYDGPGYESVKSLAATCLTSDLPDESIVKKSATARGQSWRVDSISSGGTFSTITLTQVTKS